MIDTPGGEKRPSTPRKSPCASCPFRRGVPSGIWDTEEYGKLAEYDTEMAEQPLGAFKCHQGDKDGDVCAGWLGYKDPNDLLAVRLGTAMGHLDPSCLDYTTTVPLFASGAEAAEHGMAEVDAPGAEAIKAIEKIRRKRGI